MIKFINDFKSIDVSIVRVMKNGFKFSFIVFLIATYILYLYILNPASHIAFEVGYAIIKSSIMLFVCFLVGALTSNKIQHRIQK